MSFNDVMLLSAFVVMTEFSDVSFFWTGSDNVTYTFTGTVSIDGNGNDSGISGAWYDTTGKKGTWRVSKG